MIHHLPRLHIISIWQEDGVREYRNSLVSNGIKNNSIDIFASPFSAWRNGDAIKEYIRELNRDPRVSGIIWLTPVPSERWEERIYDSIDPKKDVDCQTHANFQAFLDGKTVPFAPATAEAVRSIIEAQKIQNLKVAIVGKGPAVGLPLAELYRRQGVDYVSIESYTKNNPHWEEELRDSGANVVVWAARGAYCINASNIPERAQFYVDVAYCNTQNEQWVWNIDQSIKSSIQGIQNYEVWKATTRILIEHVKRAHEIMRSQ